jgi:hypothetical protein
MSRIETCLPYRRRWVMPAMLPRPEPPALHNLGAFLCTICSESVCKELPRERKEKGVERLLTET